MKLTVETSELIRAFGSVVQLASDDFTRPHMNGILVRQRCASQLAPLGTLEVVATDGHGLALWTSTPTHDEGEKSFGDFEVIVPLASVKEILAMAKRAKIGEVTFEGKNQSSPIEVRIGIIGASLTFRPPMGVMFPPFEQIIPKPEIRTPGQGIGVGVDLLCRSLKAFDLAIVGLKESNGKAIKTKPVYIEYPSGDHDPIVLAREGCPLLVVVMPCRLYDMKGEDKNNAPKSRRPVESPKSKKKAKVA